MILKLIIVLQDFGGDRNSVTVLGHVIMTIMMMVIVILPMLIMIMFNYQDFGGDRNSVTVLGHGTGAACLHYLMTSDALPHGEMFAEVCLHLFSVS